MAQGRYVRLALGGKVQNASMTKYLNVVDLIDVLVKGRINLGELIMLRPVLLVLLGFWPREPLGLDLHLFLHLVVVVVVVLLKFKEGQQVLLRFARAARM